MPVKIAPRVRSYRDFNLRTRPEAAKNPYRRKPSTLARWAREGKGPRITWIGNTPYYSDQAIADDLAAREKAPGEKP